MVSDRTLYKATSAWELPSYSAASIQAEAYCRLAELDIAAESKSSSSASPSGQLPAFEDAEGLHMPVLENEYDEFEAARNVIQIAKGHKDIDTQLTPEQKSLCIAFSALIRLHLEPATLYTTWGEEESFTKFIKPLVGADLPFPFGFFTAQSQSRKALKRLGSVNKEQIYTNAVRCYEAIAQHLQSAKGKYLLGDKASSADAFLFGHLCLHLRAPISAPELRQATEQHSVLRQYAERIFEHFGQPLPSPPPPSENPDWVERQQHRSSNGQRPKKTVQMSQADKDRRWRNWIWLGGAAAIFAVYVVFSGNVLQFELQEDEEFVEED